MRRLWVVFGLVFHAVCPLCCLARVHLTKFVDTLALPACSCLIDRGKEKDFYLQVCEKYEVNPLKFYKEMQLRNLLQSLIPKLRLAMFELIEQSQIAKKL